jgi:CheY-like chemotaxis protein
VSRILLADDDIVFRNLLRELLESAGYQVVVVADGKAAIGHVRTGDFDALIADIIMPNMDGLELIRTLRSERPDLPVIAISGTAGEERGQDYLPAAATFGATATVGKRRITEIVDLVDRLIAERDSNGAEVPLSS